MAELTRWQDIAPKDAVDLNLAERLDITAPLNENGERCPWPWEPQQLKDAPLGQFRCSYCFAMCVAGMEHFDYTGDTFADGGPGRDHDPLCVDQPGHPHDNECECWCHGQDAPDTATNAAGDDVG